MLFFNEDPNHFTHNCYSNKIKITKDVLVEYIKQFQDTQITDISLGVNFGFMMSMIKTKVMENYADKYKKTVECGVPVDYQDSDAKVIYEMEKQGLDRYKIWIEEIRKIGRKAWLSIRMNDCHDFQLNSPTRLKSEYAVSHNELWRVRYRDAAHFNDRISDFGLEEVRNIYLRYVDELLENYAPDGLELDFMREIYVFEWGKEYDNMSIMTDFISQIKDVVVKHEKRCNHSIKMSILMPSNIETAFNLGFDIKDICDKKLVDYVIVLPRWETTNTDIPIGLWKRLLNNNAKLGASMQVLVKTCPQSIPYTISMGQAFAQSIANLSLGADFTYLYNFFFFDKDFWKTLGIETNSDSFIYTEENIKRIWKNIGEFDSLLNQKRNHVMTFDDMVVAWENKTSRLPLKISNNLENPWVIFLIRIAVGKIKDGSNVSFVVGFENEIKHENLNVYINSEKVEYVGKGERYDHKENAYKYSVPSDLINNYAVIEFRYNDEAVIDYAEIIVEPN